jgi:hypothetical protein
MIGNGRLFKTRSGSTSRPGTGWVRCTGAQLVRANCRCLQCRCFSFCQVPPPPLFLRGLSAESGAKRRGNGAPLLRTGAVPLHPPERDGFVALGLNFCAQTADMSSAVVSPCAKCRRPPFLGGLSAESNVSVRGKAPVDKNRSSFRLHPARRLPKRLPGNDQHFAHHRQFCTRATAASLHRPRTTGSG